MKKEMREKEVSQDETKSAKGSKLDQINVAIKSYIDSHYELHYNVLDSCYEIREAGSTGPFRLLDEREMNSLTLEIAHQGVDCYDRDMRRYIHSKDIADYNPIHDYLKKLPKWDGVDRVDEVSSRINADPFWKSLFHHWLLGVVAQWMGINKMHGNSLMPILISHKQGLKKSTFCKSLLPPFLRKYYTDICDINSNSNIPNMLAKNALVNLDEMNRLGASKMAQLKNFIQLSEVKIKQPHQNSFILLPRVASFIATSNFKELLTDPTGNRRYIPIELQNIIGRIRIAHRQFYAQLMTELIRKRMRYWLTPAEEQQLMKRNIAFSKRPYEEGLFYDCFRLPKEGEAADKMPIHQIFDILRKKSLNTMRDITMASFSQHLAMIGVKHEHSLFGTLYHVVRLDA